MPRAGNVCNDDSQHYLCKACYLREWNEHGYAPPPEKYRFTREQATMALAPVYNVDTDEVEQRQALRCPRCASRAIVPGMLMTMEALRRNV